MILIRLQINKKCKIHVQLIDGMYERTQSMSHFIHFV